MGEFPSGQRGQTVNLLAMPSVVRIHLPPPAKRQAKACLFAFLWIRKAALGNSPGDCCNRRGFSAEKRIHLPPPAIRQAKACLFAFFVDSKGGSWQQSGGLLQPPWLFRRKANPPSPTRNRQVPTEICRFLLIHYSLFIITLFILLQVFALLFSFALNIMYTSRHLNQRSDTHEIHHQGGL